MIRPLLCTVALLVLTAPAAVAQDPHGPLVQKGHEEADEAQRDPAGFVQDAGSPDGVHSAAEWSAAYSCYAADWAGAQAGVDPPDLEPCREYEDVLRGPQPSVAPAPDVQPFQPGVVDKAQDLLGEAEDGVSDVVEDPVHGPDRLVRLVESLLEFVTSLVDHVRGAVAEAVGTLATGVGRTSGAIAEGVNGALAGIADAANEAATGIGPATAKAGAALADAGRAVEEWGSGVAHWVASLVPGDGSKGPPDGHPAGPEDGPDPLGRAKDVVCVECLLEKAGGTP